jgi:phenylacetate-CoA ligase
MFRETLSYYLQLRKSQWWPREKLLEFQWKKAKAIIDHAYENVPFYQEKFDKAGIKPSDIRSLSDLTQVPPSTKQELRLAFPGRWLAKNYLASECVEAATSGSTGAPLAFFLDRRSLAWRFALNMRTLEFSTYRPPQKLFQVAPPLSGKIAAGKAGVIDVLLRRLTVSPFEADVDSKFKRLIDYKPSAIVGYTSYIKALADIAGSRALKIPTIMTTSETLLDTTRAQLAEAFGGQVFDQYGSVETGRSAGECIAGGYHINLEGVLLEIVGPTGEPAKPGESGEVLLTHLMNYATPFIRYRLEDTASFAPDLPCGCGRELPSLGSIGGRLNDVIVTPRGRKIIPQFFSRTIREITGLREFQVMQSSPETINLLYVAGPDLDESARRQVEEKFARELSDVKLTWKRVNNIAKINGKHRYIVSLDRPPAP